MKRAIVIFVQRFCLPTSFVLCIALCRVFGQQSELPSEAKSFLESACVPCHSGVDAEAGLSIDLDVIDWGNRQHSRHWEKIHAVIDRGVMPPADADQPTAAGRQTFLTWLEREMGTHGPVGGTHLRRLSKRELRNTIRQVTQIGDFELPASFPPDNLVQGFDNVSSGLNLAPAHMDAIAEMASAVADAYFPPREEMPKPSSTLIPASDMVISYSSACLIDGEMRLASSGKNERRNSTWPAKFVARVTGLYDVRIAVRGTGQPGDVPQQLEIATMDPNGRKSFQKHNLLDIAKRSSTDPLQQLRFRVRIPAGHTLVLRYANGPLDYDDKKKFQETLLGIFREDPKLAAAWKKVGSPARGGNGWEQVQAAMRSSDLEIESLREDPKALEALAKKYAGNSVLTGETIVYKFFEEGPYLSVAEVELSGPFDPEPSRELRLAAKRAERFLGGEGLAENQEAWRSVVTRFQEEAFRRTPSANEVDTSLALMQLVLDDGYSLEQAYHIVIRKTLMSPAFLFRCTGNQDFGELLNNHDLASRLSYFLTSMPPDEQLLMDAKAGRLSSNKVLKKHAKRLLDAAGQSPSNSFAGDFTGAWLQLATLETLMPDPNLIRKFSELRDAVRQEPEDTFRLVLSKNAPAPDLIAPDFVVTTSDVASELYSFPKGVTKKSKRSVAIAVDRFDWRGGLLGMPATMIATANGVDTQPVLRGVWVLENILGRPPLDPPQAVPALTPDVGGQLTPKEMLAAHTKESSCAVCHREIDPLGFALENLDPVGRWRDTYPARRAVARTKSRDALVDASGQLPDGTVILNQRDLKKYLYEHPEPFVLCLSEKLMVYATGREMTFRECKEIQQIVREAAGTGYALKDLILALVQSEVFRRK